MANEKRMFLVPESVMTEIFSNLSSQPWIKVNGLILELNRCKPVTIPENPAAQPQAGLTVSPAEE